MNNDIPFFVRATFRGETEMLKLDQNDISFENFKKKCR